MFWLILFGPILIPLSVGALLVVNLKRRQGLPVNAISPRFSAFFFAWGGLFAIAWIIIVLVVTAAINSNTGPVALIAIPWAFALGAGFGVLRWYLKCYRDASPAPGQGA
jgi:L-asparagine transporter-like permease